MLFAVDYNNTWSKDPEFFRALIRMMRGHGHEAVLVTSRSPDGVLAQEVEDMAGDVIPIVFADDHWKREAALEAGYDVDVWIDDRPGGIVKPKKKCKKRKNK